MNTSLQTDTYFDPQAVRIMIADDHSLFRRGLRQLCEVEGGFQVVAEATNGKEAITLADKHQPDIILMDIRMPVIDGVKATRIITNETPLSKVVMLTLHRQDRFVFEAVKAGARGYLLKDVEEDVLIEAIQSVYKGASLIDPQLATRVLDEFRRLKHEYEHEQDDWVELTEHELEILSLVAQGSGNDDIAILLNISEKTVANRLTSIYEKLQVNNRTQAALYALKQGWASLDTEIEI
ncbi:MAG: response regulator transcription factor [Chloroflexota bacterium]